VSEYKSSDHSGDWVKRKFFRQKMLREHAADVWDSAWAAIQDSCNSFQSYYGKGQSIEGQFRCDLKQELENGHRIRLLLTIQKPTPEMGSITPVGKRILIAFDKSVPEIAVVVDDAVPLKFPIKADETHAFIEWQGREIGSDEFSQTALENILFSDLASH
jgi:hypothetical protein